MKANEFWSMSVHKNILSADCALTPFILPPLPKNCGNGVHYVNAYTYSVQL